MTNPNKPPSVRDVRALIDKWRQRIRCVNEPPLEHLCEACQQIKDFTDELDTLIGSAPLDPPEDVARRLQSSLDALYGAKFSDRVYAALKSRAETAEAKYQELRERAEQDWQPIATAPKNELLLLYRPGLRPADRIAVRRVSDWCGPKCCPEVEPTHWRPLPDPPVAAVDPLRGPQPEKTEDDVSRVDGERLSEGTGSTAKISTGDR